MKIKIEHDAIILTVGAMGSGKSTFCAKHFHEYDIVATDFIRHQLTGDFQNQDVNEAVFDILYATVTARAKMGLLTVIDSTGTGSVISHALKDALDYKRPLYAFIFDPVPETELTVARMGHRMKVLDVYHRQVARITKTTYPKAMRQVLIPTVGRSEVTLQVIGPQGTHSADLDPQKHYIVIPDLHGCYRTLDPIIAKISDDPNLMAVSLGDIVDRGPSSYHTFLKINELRIRGKLVSTTSNHDHKFYRWCKKFLEGANTDVRGQGMKLSNGLEKTVDELLALPAPEQLKYAEDFIVYFNSCQPALFLKKDAAQHVFVHAGVTKEVFRSRNFGAFDLSAFMFQGSESVEDIERMRDNTADAYVIHVGHNFGYHMRVRDKFEISRSASGMTTLIEHDVGLGKRDDFLPVFCEID